MRQLIHLFVLSAVVLLMAITCLSQTQDVPTPQPDDRIVVGTNLITLNVIVTDSKGRYVTGLRNDQFAVFDDRIRQRIAHFSAEESPVTLGIVCEIHYNTPDRARALLNAIRRFTATLRRQDRFFFVGFSYDGSVSTDFIPTLDQLIDHLKFVKRGPSSLYDAVYLAGQRLQSAPNLKKALLVVSDGRDENSRHTYKELCDRLRMFDAQIYAIGIADPALDPYAGYDRWVFEDVTRGSGRRPFLFNSDASLGRAVLSELSQLSGGTTYFPDSESEPELTAICTQISVELRHQYTLGFYSRQPNVSGWHRLKVEVHNPEERSTLTLSYRKGYQIAGS